MAYPDYVKTDWVDLSTLVDEARLDHMEAGIDLATDAANDLDSRLNAHVAAADPHTGYQKESEEGQPNGYASLDATGKVPAAQLPAAAAMDGDVDFIGTWGVGTAYKRGDVVTYNGRDYLAVNDSTGVTPPAPASIPLSGVSVGTTLPAAPYDTQEFVLVDSLTAPTYSWRLRYTASVTGANKWIFVGGAPISTEVLGAETGITSTTPVDGTTVCSLTVPRAGSYDIEFGVALYNSVNDIWSYCAPKLGAAAASANDSVYVRPRAGDWISLARRLRRPLAASDVVKLQLWVSAASTLQAEKRWLAVTPVAVA